MVCPDCAAAADYDAQSHPVEAITVHTLAEHEWLRRGHARCRAKQLVTGQGSLPDGTAVTIQGHHCDCQHVVKTVVLGNPKVVPARQEPPQSDEAAVVEG
jgi:hypothetical protein